MKAQIFENIELLQAYLRDKKSKNIEVKFTSTVVGNKEDKVGAKVFEIVDRFLVIEN